MISTCIKYTGFLNIGIYLDKCIHLNTFCLHILFYPDKLIHLNPFCLYIYLDKLMIIILRIVLSQTNHLFHSSGNT